MERVYKTHLKEFLGQKIILLTGPRQAGKTTLSKMLSVKNQYLNFDNSEHREIIFEKSWDRKKDLIILDELHKMKNWKSWIKGVYDVEGAKPALLVTGSAKLDTYKKVGDSLAGRFFRYRLHPLDIRELYSLNKKIDFKETIDHLLNYSGFPEPFLKNSKRFYNLWKKTHLDIILKQDLITIENIRDIRSIEILIDLLKDRVSSPLSYTSLVKDLQYTDKTIKRWLTILENMYVIFKITPYHKNIARSHLKQPKYYFYDNAQVNDGVGARLENLVATSLLKECQFRQDVLGEDWNLYYLSKNKEGAEVDFLVTKDKKPYCAVEVKTSDDKPARGFKAFEEELKEIPKIQIVKNLKQEKTFANGLEIRKLGEWLSTWT